MRYCKLCGYDDNTLYSFGFNVENVISKLEKSAKARPT